MSSAYEPSWKRCESPESFHDWFSSPRGVRRSYSTNPSPSRSPYSSIQRKRGERRLAQPLDDRRFGAPAPDLREQDQVERRCVDGAVIGAEPGLGGTAAAELVQDLARLGVDRGVVLTRLERRERIEGCDRELRAEQHRLQARNQCVAPEDGHEPRHSGGRKHPEAAVRPHPQRRQVGDRPGE